MGTWSPEGVGVGAAPVFSSINLSTWFFQLLELEEKEKSGPELRLVELEDIAGEYFMFTL